MSSLWQYKIQEEGSYQCNQRYRCSHCNRYFSDKVCKFNYSDKERFLEMYLNNVVIRKAAIFMGCSPSLLIVWLKEFAKNFKRQLDLANNKLSEDSIPDIIEMDELYTRIKKGLPEYRLIVGLDVKLLRIE